LARSFKKKGGGGGADSGGGVYLLSKAMESTAGVETRDERGGFESSMASAGREVRTDVCRKKRADQGEYVKPLGVDYVGGGRHHSHIGYVRRLLGAFCSRHTSAVKM